MGDNTIKILIEGDATGLTSSLRSALDSVKKNVNQMNDQQVNWDSILAKTISPTMIAAIGATFANSMAQFINFNNAATNLNNVGGAATKDFANSIGTMGGAAYTLAETSGQSLGDTASSFEAFMKAGLNSAAATDAVTRASGLARATGTDLGTMTSSLVGLFNQWGVTTLPQVELALTGLANAAQNGKFTFSELVDAITPQGQLLKTKTNISNIAVQLAELSSNSGLSKQSVLDTFNAIAKASQSGSEAAIIMSAGFGKAATDITGPNGLVGAFTAIKTSVDKEGSLIANSFGNQVGIMNTDIAGFQAVSVTGFKVAGTAADDLEKHLIPLDKLILDNTSAAQKLDVAWTNFKTSLAELTLPAAIGTLTSAFDSINKAMSGGISWEAFWKAVPSGVSQVAQGAAAGGAAVETQVGNAILGLFNAIGLKNILGTNNPLTNLPLGNAPIKSGTSNTINTTINMPNNSSSANSHILGNTINEHLSNGFYGMLAS